MDEERDSLWEGASAKEVAMLVAVVAVLISLYAFSVWR
jgi:Flp pilus assembly pilin Flp